MVPRKVIYLGLMATLVSMFPMLIPAANSESISELESKASRFQSDAQEIYRFDSDALQTIWGAYCGKLDPGTIEWGERFAAEIGLTLQQQERDKVGRLLNDVKPLIESATRLQDDPDSKDKAGKIIEDLRKEERKLQDLDQGVVLKGSNHPFTQYAIEYGKKQHIEQCDRNGELPKVCDKSWPTLSGRPDLVFVDDSGLWIYEFKPDNSDARSLGEKQVRGYVEGVEQYYQHFFQKGRTGGFTDTPDSDHGDKAILEKLEKTPRAWSSDGSALQAQWKVVSYPMCEKKF
jgi:hypothetical protein